MSKKAKTIKLVRKVLKDKQKRKFYSNEELLYMERYVVLLEEERKRRIAADKKHKGFGYDSVDPTES